MEYDPRNINQLEDYKTRQEQAKQADDLGFSLQFPLLDLRLSDIVRLAGQPRDAHQYFIHLASGRTYKRSIRTGLWSDVTGERDWKKLHEARMGLAGQ